MGMTLYDRSIGCVRVRGAVGGSIGCVRVRGAVGGVGGDQNRVAMKNFSR
jgi:hypothetical protein